VPQTWSLGIGVRPPTSTLPVPESLTYAGSPITDSLFDRIADPLNLDLTNQEGDHKMTSDNDEPTGTKSMVKVVYFDEQSASDYLDITAGGSTSSTSEEIKERASDLHAKVETKLSARLSWLPFIGASGEAGTGFDYKSVGQSILSQTLSNTILTDYLAEIVDDDRIRRLNGYVVTAPEGSMAAAKMYTPYMVIAKTEEFGVDLARLDEALERAKGYYELLATNENDPNDRCVLRFNFRAFRNNYGLSDLGRMRLAYHAILVGETTEKGLTMDGEMAGGETATGTQAPTALDLIDGPPVARKTAVDKLDVYDVVLAGVERG